MLLLLLLRHRSMATVGPKPSRGGGARAGAESWSGRRRRTAPMAGCPASSPVRSPDRGAPGVQRQPKGRITSLSIDRVGLPSNGFGSANDGYEQTIQLAAHDWLGQASATA